MNGKPLQVSVFHHSVQGANHIRRNKECQDVSYSYSDTEHAIAIVCDGHGGDDYIRSAFGAKYACQAAANSIEIFLRGVDQELFLQSENYREEKLDWLEASIINSWNHMVDTHCAEHPFTEEETAVLSSRARHKYLESNKIASAYGTTLLAVVMTCDYWFGIQIGDGKCVAVDRKSNFTQPIPWDEKCFLNATTSICDSNAIENFRHYYSDQLPAAVFIASDGVDDSFLDDHQLNHLYQTVLYSFATTDFYQADADFADFLPRLSEKGSGDDVSVSAILDLDAIHTFSTIQKSENEMKKASADNHTETVSSDTSTQGSVENKGMSQELKDTGTETTVEQNILS